VSSWDIGTFTAELVERAGSALDLQALRRCILDGLRSSFGCDSAYWGDGLRRYGHHVCLSSDAVTRAALARFSGARDRYDVPAAMRAVYADGGACIDLEVFSRVERDRLPLYADVVRPAGIRTYLAGLPSFREQPFSLISLARHTRGAGFTGAEKERLRSMLASLGLVEAAFGSGALAAASHENGLSDAPTWQRLSPREAQVADLITRGLQNKEIAQLLGTSLDTVRKQSIRVYEKLGVTGRVQLLARSVAANGRV